MAVDGGSELCRRVDRLDRCDGAWTHTAAAPGAVGRVLLVHLVQDGTLSSPTITSVTNAENLAGTDNVLTYIGEFDIGSAVVASQHLWIGRSLSTSAMVITGANSGGDDVYVRVYELLQNVNVGTAITDVIENGSAGATANGAGTGTTITDTGVTTLGSDRLALQLVGVNDDIAVISGFAAGGASGGTWGGFQNYSESSGTDADLHLNTATMASAGTINGASETISPSAGWGVVGFALIGTTVSGTPHTASPADSVALSDNISPVHVPGFTPGPAIRRQRRAHRFLTTR